MKSKILRYSLIVGIPIGMGYLSFQYESKFITDNLSKILLPILLAILAVTNTSLALVIGKLQELANKLAVDFEKTNNEIKKAYMYQIVNLIFAIIFLILLNSKIFIEFHICVKYTLDTLLLLCLSVSLSILFDIWNSIFDIIKEIAKMR